MQSNGENYLIPVDANIQSESFLRRQAIAVQEMLDELNEAKNELNVVVLDACRDNPFAWKRSGSRGLQVVGNQPADSIIVFATSAGSTAADGSGRNGLFTGHLLQRLKTPGLEVTEVFRLTMGDVARSSDNQQRPAVYNQFYGLAYLGSKPATAAQSTTTTAPVQQPADTTQTPTPATRTETTAQTYKIGDRGPAGGIIFYDKGQFSDGWRYMEAAPSDLQNAQWGLYGENLAGTKIEIGSGKQNTELIIAALNKKYEKGKAAQLCKAYSLNGYSDWFLPSKDELNLLYTNLKKNNMGGFKELWYWSSSQYNNGNDYAWAEMGK